MNSAILQTLLVLYKKHTGLSEATIATYCAGQAYFFQRLRDGATITIKRYNRVIQWFSDHWPKDLSWPVDIPRPAASPESRLKNVTKSGNDTEFCNAPITEAAQIKLNLAAFAARHGYAPGTVRQVVKRYVRPGAGTPKLGTQTYRILRTLSDELGCEVGPVTQAMRAMIGSMPTRGNG